MWIPVVVPAQLDFDSAIDAVGKRISFKIYEQERSRVAVANLVDHTGEENELGGLISEEMTVSLLKHSRSFEVMDRGHLAAIIEEHRLALGGLMNDSTLIELGRLESVEVVITGTITRLGARYKVTVKALDTQTGLVVAADREYFQAERFLDEYYGLETGVPNPEPDPRPNPVKMPIGDCATGKHGTVYVQNSRSYAVTVSLEAKDGKRSCKGKITFEVKAGETNHVRGICAGNITYEIIKSHTRDHLSRGTIYMKPCGERAIKL